MTSVSSTGSTSYYYAMQKKVFDRLDTDSNGSLEENELLAGKPKNLTRDRASELYEALDTNESGGLTLDEFAGGTASGVGVNLISQLPTDALDVLLQLRQQGGLISNAGSRDGEKSATDAAFDALDTDRDGVVSEQEFLATHGEDVSGKEAAVQSGADEGGTATRKGTATPSSGVTDLFSLLDSETGDTSTSAA